MDYLGIRAVGSTVEIYFTSHAATGAPVAPSSAFETADVKLYKNGSATERTSQAGWTMTSPFDSITGLHCLAIDLSDNTDPGFYAAGSRYVAVLSPDETVDGLAVVRVLAAWDIGVAPANVTQFAGSAITSAAGIPEVKVASIAANAITATAINADAITNAKIADDAIAVENLKDGAITAAKIATDAIDADAVAADALAEILAQVSAALTATIADSVPADGTRPSIASGIYMLVQFMLERTVSGTTMTVKKPDGSTTLLTLTLDDADAPTSVTRS